VKITSKENYDKSSRYLPEWESQHVWVTKDPARTESAFCKLCCTKIQPKRSNTASHEKKVKHKNGRSLEGTPSLVAAKKRRIEDDLKRAEISVVACCKRC